VMLCAESTQCAQVDAVGILIPSNLDTANRFCYFSLRSENEQLDHSNDQKSQHSCNTDSNLEGLKFSVSYPILRRNQFKWIRKLLLLLLEIITVITVEILWYHLGTLDFDF